jgi:CHASE3 domain sensor protein
LTILLESRPNADSHPSRWDAVSTVVVIRALAAAAILVAIVLGLVLAASASSVRDGINVIGRQTAPQVIATEDFYFALSDMDAQLTNVLLAGDDPDLAEVRTTGLQTFEQRRLQANADLQQAAIIAGTDATAQRNIGDVLNQMGAYQALAARTIALNDSEGSPAGRPSQAVLALHRQATDLMAETLRTSRRLTDANSTLLDRSYEDKRGATVTARWWLAILGGLLVVTLVGLQVALRVRMRRRINPALVLATVLAGGLTIGGSGLMAAESEYLRAARKDAFASILALRQAQAVSYDANADESRYLVDPERARQYQRAFLDKSELLAGVGAGDVGRYDAALAEALDAYHADNSDVRFSGFYGIGMNNITFVGEREAAENVMATFQVYQRDDRTIRAMVERGDLEGAIAFCTEVSPGTSNYNFYAYDDALTAWLDLNESAFDTFIADGESAVRSWTALIPYAGAALIVLLVSVGVWPRLAEYR